MDQCGGLCKLCAGLPLLDHLHRQHAALGQQRVNRVGATGRQRLASVAALGAATAITAIAAAAAATAVADRKLRWWAVANAVTVIVEALIVNFEGHNRK